MLDQKIQKYLTIQNLHKLIRMIQKYLKNRKNQMFRMILNCLKNQKIL